MDTTYVDALPPEPEGECDVELQQRVIDYLARFPDAGGAVSCLYMCVCVCWRRTKKEEEDATALAMHDIALALFIAFSPSAPPLCVVCAQTARLHRHPEAEEGLRQPRAAAKGEKGSGVHACVQKELKRGGGSVTCLNRLQIQRPDPPAFFPSPQCAQNNPPGDRGVRHRAALLQLPPTPLRSPRVSDDDNSETALAAACVPACRPQVHALEHAATRSHTPLHSYTSDGPQACIDQVSSHTLPLPPPHIHTHKYTLAYTCIYTLW